MPRGGGCHLCRPLGAALQPRWRLSRPSPTTKASSWWVALLQGAAAAAGATRAAQAASRRHRERPNDAMWSQLRRTGCCGSWDGAPARVAAVQRWLLMHMPLRQIGLSSALHRCKATWRWSEGERMLCGLEEGAATCCRLPPLPAAGLLSASHARLVPAAASCPAQRLMSIVTCLQIELACTLKPLQPCMDQSSRALPVASSVQLRRPPPPQCMSLLTDVPLPSFAHALHGGNRYSGRWRWSSIWPAVRQR